MNQTKTLSVPVYKPLIEASDLAAVTKVVSEAWLGQGKHVKKFEINSTPTLIINNKKFDKPLTYKNLKKTIEKLI